MRFVPVAVGNTDAVHIYSDAGSILLQLRRDVPTEQSIAKPSFKVALTLTPQQAIAVAAELLTAATKSAPNNVRNEPAIKPPLQNQKSKIVLSQNGDR